MNQKIVCEKGSCHELGSIESEFDSLFDTTNIVDQIKLDLLKNMIK